MRSAIGSVAASLPNSEDMYQPNSEDMYQLTAYLHGTPTSRRAPDLYERRVASHAVDVVGADITIYCHALDPTAPPAELLASIDMLVEAMRARHGGEFSMTGNGSRSLQASSIGRIAGWATA